MEEKIIKKSELNLQDAYDYGRITVKRERFIPCILKEEEEDIELQFDMDGLKPLPQIRRDKEENKLLLLLDALKLSELLKEYRFDLRPDNLFYDANYKVSVQMRDVYSVEAKPDEEDIFKREKALCGYVLQNKYSYEDYYNGGMELLKRQKNLKEIYEKSSIEELQGILNSRHRQLLEKKAKYMWEVKKSDYLAKSILAVFCSLLAVGLIGFGVYYYETTGKVRKTLLMADNCYIAGDMISMIDTMESLSISQLDLEHKFILAQAYIRSEDLTVEQKENILAAFTLTSNEKLMEYWIHIGRLEVEEAENIAMQYSDNELLLYAYMKDRALTESNTSMDGSEKQQRLSELEGKIEDLAEPYMQEEGQAD